MTGAFADGVKVRLGLGTVLACPRRIRPTGTVPCQTRPLTTPCPPWLWLARLRFFGRRPIRQPAAHPHGPLGRRQLPDGRPRRHRFRPSARPSRVRAEPGGRPNRTAGLPRSPGGWRRRPAAVSGRVSLAMPDAAYGGCGRHDATVAAPRHGWWRYVPRGGYRR
ncbi:hypothetical protein CDD83_4494 [Cordyceps sp. RAO-2017]|nr:hypothetical protein CDD83_4494 [Cordyceps sp. RAO-2017]